MRTFASVFCSAAVKHHGQRQRKEKRVYSGSQFRGAESMVVELGHKKWQAWWQEAGSSLLEPQAHSRERGQAGSGGGW